MAGPTKKAPPKEGTDPEMIMISLQIPVAMLEAIEEYGRTHGERNRSAIVRSMIRMVLNNDRKTRTNVEAGRGHDRRGGIR